MLVVEALPWPPNSHGDFAPFVMTIEEWDAQRVGFADGRTLAGTSVYRLEYASRADWTLTLLSDDVPGYGFVQTPGQGNACRGDKYGQIDPSGGFRVTDAEPGACNGIGRWIHYGIAWSYPWPKEISDGLVTYTSTGERVVFDLRTGLPVLYEAGRPSGPIGHRTVFRLERLTIRGSLSSRA